MMLKEVQNILEDQVRKSSSLTKDDKKDKLVHGIYGYSQDLASTYDDNGQQHSPIIGWAYDAEIQSMVHMDLIAQVPVGTPD